MPADFSGNLSWMLTSSALVLIMTPGLAFFYGGLVKRKNIINTIMSSVILMGIASLLWVLIGFTMSFHGGEGGIIGDFGWFGLSFDSLTGHDTGVSEHADLCDLPDDVRHHYARRSLRGRLPSG